MKYTTSASTNSTSPLSSEDDSDAGYGDTSYLEA